MKREWVDFLICLVFGGFGVHKFREGKIGIGILYLFTGGIFAIGWFIDCIRYLIAAINGKRIVGSHIINIQLRDDEPLPVVQGNAILSSGDVCHYSNVAKCQEIRNKIVGHTSGSSGMNIRIMKGVTYRTGGSRGHAIREDVAEYYPGILNISDERIVFTGEKAFDKKIKNLSSVTPYKDGIELQFGEKTYKLLTPEAIYINQILCRIINNN